LNNNGSSKQDETDAHQAMRAWSEDLNSPHPEGDGSAAFKRARWRRSTEQMLVDGEIMRKKVSSTSASKCAKDGKEMFGGTVLERKDINFVAHDVINLWAARGDFLPTSLIAESLALASTTFAFM
jgi:hypothetical protein